MRWTRAAVAVMMLVAASPVAARAPRIAPRSADAPLRLESASSEPLKVSGLHRYFDDLELKAAPDGLVVVNVLPLERYLLGLNEVPTDWPMAALRAQAVAARTYASWTLQRPRGGAAAAYGFDICASELCQVFAGADVLGAPDGARWAEAVRSTAGEVMLFGGGPILARYHSTSGGRTLDNSDAFPGEPDLPYLRSVASTDEEASPLYRWEVRFRLPQLQAILEEAGWWDGTNGTLRSVRTRPTSSGRHYPDVLLDGRRDVRHSAEDLREALRSVAPRLFPARYPSRAPTASGRLPETLPSNRITIETDDGWVRVEGRGWGHGVGMSQWGAHGLATRGWTYREILTHYYRGAALGTAADPGAVEVGVAWGLRSVKVFGSFRVLDAGGSTIVERALGTWGFSARASGSVGITPPRGFGRPLHVRIVRAPSRVAAGRLARVVIRLSTPARVAVHGPRDNPPRPAVTRDAGIAAITWRAPREPGRYTLRVRARSSSQARAAKPVAIEVVSRLADGERSAGGRGSDPGIVSWLAAIVLLGLVAVGAVSFAGTIRR